MTSFNKYKQLIGLIVFCVSFVSAQNENGLVNWLTFAEAQQKNKEVQNHDENNLFQ
jgi:hypothetical protein